MFVDVRELLLQGEFGKLFAVGEYLFQISGVCRKMRTEVKIMQECIFFIPHVYECGIEARHEFLHLCQVNVADSVSNVPCLFLKADQTAVFQKSDRNFSRLCVNYQFAFHCLWGVL